MKIRTLLQVVCAFMVLAPSTRSAEDLRLNPRLDYSSDSQDGSLITGSDMESGAVSGKPNYVIVYGEGCFNSKRQARRTVNLYEKYRGRVNFVVIDLDKKRSQEQQELLKKYYKGYIPHVVLLDRQQSPLYNNSGEIEEAQVARILDSALR
jgi:hypothetical protein